MRETSLQKCREGTEQQIYLVTHPSPIFPGLTFLGNNQYMTKYVRD